MIKCVACGKYLHEIEINVFGHDGDDYWTSVPVGIDEEENAVVSFETTHEWTGEELSFDEQKECIRCPHCKATPFGLAEINMYRPVVVILHLDEGGKADGR